MKSSGIADILWWSGYSPNTMHTLIAMKYQSKIYLKFELVFSLDIARSLSAQFMLKWPNRFFFVLVIFMH